MFQKTFSSCDIPYKTILKKLNFYLQKNFFTLEEFQVLPFRKAVRVVRLIGKINGYRLRRSEVKNIAFNLQNLSKKTPQIIISKFFN